MKKLLSFFVFVTFVFPLLTLADGPINLGSIRVDNMSGADSLDVRNICGITKIRFRARGAEIKLKSADIDFVSPYAANDRISIRMRLAPGESTPWYDLRGEERCVDRIRLDAKIRDFFRAGYIDAIGYQTGHMDEAIRLGVAELTERMDSDIVDTRTVCGIREVKIRVVGDDAQIDYLGVKIQGQPGFQRVDVRENFREGSESMWKDLQGHERCVTGFFVRGRSSGAPRNARVILFGR